MKIHIYKAFNNCNDREHLLYQSKCFVHSEICKFFKKKRKKIYYAK